MAEIDTSKAKLEIGMQAPDFTLKNVDDTDVSLSDFADKKALVVVFMCNHCPYVQAYTERIINIQKDFADKGVQVIAISSNDEKMYPEDSFDKMKVYARIRNFPFPYLHDADQSVAKAYDAQCTPEVMIFDAEKKLAYHGKIDDNYQDSTKAKEHYVVDALNALLEGREIEKPHTYAIGCSIKWAQ